MTTDFNPLDHPEADHSAAGGPAVGGPEAERREAGGPVSRVRLADGRTAWLLTGHADVVRVLNDPRFSRAAAVLPAPRATPDVAIRSSPDALINMDPPRHTAVRRLITAGLPRRVRAIRPRLARTATRLLAGIAADGPPADFVARYALPLPTIAICDLLGVPEEDHHLFHAWARVRYLDAEHTAEQATEAFDRLRDHLSAIIARRRAEPAEDLVSDIVRASEQPSEGELLTNLLAFVIAGHNNSATLLATGLLTLCRHPAQLGLLRRRPELLPGAVEETLRHTRF
ncbi:hypothetical protein Misp01_20540 [Microtetraspora sp. NBRC 13810]|uniref:hypothetical protein n=1 Tax=Microtetraspora sp. NBRC 13810 TaxID=3030990 RepID=UPI0024A2791C|nr:hypothetical protein [Microtetraspora sp. NBRC 13810]GLW06924.1 hypothetical protein Misp01_20540 [Microtetraspora sp. NBRC 13810]